MRINGLITVYVRGKVTDNVIVLSSKSNYKQTSLFNQYTGCFVQKKPACIHFS